VVKRLFFFLFVALAVLAGLPAQTRVPSGSENWLSSAGTTGNGDVDGLNVFFFEIPDTLTSPIYFAVQDPGVNDANPQDQTDMTAGESMSFSLVGGSGTFSNPVSRKYRYSTKSEVYSAGTGSVLEQKVYSTANGNATTTGWVYFDPVYPSQGEKIGNKYYFKIIADASTGSDFKNSYRFDASLSNSGTPTGINGGAAFAYSWCFVLRPDIDDIWNFYPFVPEGAVGKWLIVGAWDFDPFGGVPVASIFDPDGVETPVTIDLASNDTDNGSVQIDTDQDNTTWRFWVSEPGSVGYPNTSEVWAWENSAAVADGVEPDESTTVMYRIYAGPYSPPTTSASPLRTEWPWTTGWIGRG